ncbi:hypothetical protein ACX27_18090 [Nostoc piscinale CENA21]|uniref:Uncharacterized protein n=1 Tax=Nostoc piscinale CENA21 TaxID=224013 RepID=A0A0M5MHQ0_9NOSO|nr:hypothetical protein [Nostoc piscinale]ALF54318.1 hypothetical protein ACX27_18090 [Nostoc piscinale CENA21]
MIAKVLINPKFTKGQEVRFIGGKGVVKNYRPESNSWLYLIEMPLRIEHEIERIGYETMIWLSESDIYSMLMAY